MNSAVQCRGGGGGVEGGKEDEVKGRKRGKMVCIQCIII
jgi:hypothetical protein